MDINLPQLIKDTTFQGHYNVDIVKIYAGIWGFKDFCYNVGIMSWFNILVLQTK